MRPRGSKVSSEDSFSALDAKVDTKVECASSPRGREVLGGSGVVSSSAATTVHSGGIRTVAAAAVEGPDTGGEKIKTPPKCART